jgi:anti-sigma factor RsiW
MNTHDDKWEDQINALLDGELNEADADQLKHAADDDSDLAGAVIEAYQLQQAMDKIQAEPAPASLRKRLLAIPREQKATPALSFLQPRWVMALAVIPLVVILSTLMQPPAVTQPEPPTTEEIAQAREDVALALAYLDKAGNFTSREIESAVGDTMTDAIAGPLIRNIKSQL